MSPSWVPIQGTHKGMKTSLWTKKNPFWRLENTPGLGLEAIDLPQNLRFRPKKVMFLPSQGCLRPQIDEL